MLYQPDDFESQEEADRCFETRYLTKPYRKLTLEEMDDLGPFDEEEDYERLPSDQMQRCRGY